MVECYRSLCEVSLACVEFNGTRFCKICILAVYAEKQNGLQFSGKLMWWVMKLACGG